MDALPLSRDSCMTPPFSLLATQAGVRAAHVAFALELLRPTEAGAYMCLSTLCTFEHQFDANCPPVISIIAALYSYHPVSGDGTVTVYDESMAEWANSSDDDDFPMVC